MIIEVRARQVHGTTRYYVIRPHEAVVAICGLTDRLTVNHGDMVHLRSLGHAVVCLTCGNDAETCGHLQVPDRSNPGGWRLANTTALDKPTKG